METNMSLLLPSFPFHLNHHQQSMPESSCSQTHTRQDILLYMENSKKNLFQEDSRRRGIKPSFSSTLLESIYRSIDQKQENNQEQIMSSMSAFYTTRKKDKDFVVLSNSNSNSSSSSSEFWSGGLSSSDSESKPRSAMQRPKPIKTERSSSYAPAKNHDHQEKAKGMSRALKIYNELKRMKKQPLSPGGKLSNFLNSLFANPKPPRNNASKGSTPNCSSASSYTRSCLSNKTTSSKVSNKGSTRSVRFFPIVDEDHSQPQKKLHQEEEDHQLKVVRVMEEKRKMAEAARKLLESYRKSKKESYVDLLSEEDDGMSCSSSDLFELNNLSEIGIGRNTEELPVYETTHLDTNRAIAKGFIL